MPPKLAFEGRPARRMPRPAVSRRSSASSSKAIWLVGWKPGFRKIGATRALQQVAGYSLSQAKEAVDRVLDNEKVRIGLLDNIRLEPTVADLREIGFEVRLRDKDRRCGLLSCRSSRGRLGGGRRGKSACHCRARDEGRGGFLCPPVGPVCDVRAARHSRT